MQNYKSKFFKVIQNPKYIFGIYVIASLVTALTNYFRGPGAYNNYLIFKNVFVNTYNKNNLYLPYPDAFLDTNHYGIFFSVLIAPFALLPDGMGMPLWNLANVIIFLFAIYKLPFSSVNKSIFAWLCLQEYITAALSLQFNVALVGLIMLSALYIYDKKETHSALAILVGFFVKIYGIVGLSSFFFVKNKLKFIISFISIGLLFFIFPMLTAGKDFVIQSYLDWYQSLSEKNELNASLISRQDYSVMGIVRRTLGDATISGLYFMIPGIILFLAPYVRIKQYQFLAFRLMILASTLVFVVIFSSGSESPTYIIAVAGVMLWYILQNNKTLVTNVLLIFVIVLTCFGFSDLFPKFIKENYIIKYALKALPCTLVWFRITYELLTKDFSSNDKVITA